MVSIFFWYGNRYYFVVWTIFWCVFPVFVMKLFVVLTLIICILPSPFFGTATVWYGPFSCVPVYRVLRNIFSGVKPFGASAVLLASTTLARQEVAWVYTSQLQRAFVLNHFGVNLLLCAFWVSIICVSTTWCQPHERPDINRLGTNRLLSTNLGSAVWVRQPFRYVNHLRVNHLVGIRYEPTRKVPSTIFGISTILVSHHPKDQSIWLVHTTILDLKLFGWSLIIGTILVGQRKNTIYFWYIDHSPKMHQAGTTTKLSIFVVGQIGLGWAGVNKK